MSGLWDCKSLDEQSSFGKAFCAQATFGLQALRQLQARGKPPVLSVHVLRP